MNKSGRLSASKAAAFKNERPRGREKGVCKRRPLCAKPKGETVYDKKKRGGKGRKKERKPALALRFGE